MPNVPPYLSVLFFLTELDVKIIITKNKAVMKRNIRNEMKEFLINLLFTSFSFIKYF